MVALPAGKQSSIQGPAVNVPSKLDSLCTMLPRLPIYRHKIDSFQTKRYTEIQRPLYV